MKHARLALTALFAATVLTACTNAPDTLTTLDKAGFTEVETTGHTPFACGKGYVSATGFRARNGRGELITGTVCTPTFGRSAIVL